MKDNDVLLVTLAKCYLRGSLAFPSKIDVQSMTWDWQQKFLDVTVNNVLIKQYPLSNTFSKLFFKSLLAYLENLDEVHDEMYTQLCEFMNHQSSNNNFCYRHYVIGNDLTETISVKETNMIVMDGTTGLHTWEAGVIMADWSLCNKEIFTDQTILELGSGVGFTGVTIAKHCSPQSIYMTDCHSKVLNTICDNIKLNFPRIEDYDEGTMFRNNEQKIGAMILDWNAIENFPSTIIPDVIIGTDIVYDPIIIAPLCEVLKEFFDRNNKLNVYIASVIRNKNTFQAFTNTLRSMNFTLEDIPFNKSLYIDWDPSIEKCLLHVTC